MVPHPDAVVGRHGPREPGHCQCCLGFGDSLPIGPPTIIDGVIATGCDMGAGDNLVRDATGGIHSQPATEQSSGLKPEAVMLENIKQGYILQPKPSNLPVAFRLPLQLHIC